MGETEKLISYRRNACIVPKEIYYHYRLLRHVLPKQSIPTPIFLAVYAKVVNLWRTMLTREKWMLRKVQGTIVYPFWHGSLVLLFRRWNTLGTRSRSVFWKRHRIVAKRRLPFHLRTSISHRTVRTGTASSSSIHDTWSSHSSAIQWHDTHPATVPWNHASWSYKLCLRIPTSKWATMHFPPRCAFSRAPSYTRPPPSREHSLEFTTEFELRCFLTRQRAALCYFQLSRRTLRTVANRIGSVSTSNFFLRASHYLMINR